MSAIDCQLGTQTTQHPKYSSSNNSLKNPNLDSGTIRLVSKKSNTLQDTDDADPDIIPNQYGEFFFKS